MIKSLYVLSRDGHTLYFNTFSEKNGDEIAEAALFSSVISAIQGFLSEIDVGSVKSFTTEKNNIFIHTQSDIAYVLIVDLEFTIEEEDVNYFFQQLHSKLNLEYNPEVAFTLTKKENQILDQTVNYVFTRWKEMLKESKAAKRLKHDLW